jgi:hypothetical protein
MQHQKLFALSIYLFTATVELPSYVSEEDLRRSYDIAAAVVVVHRRVDGMMKMKMNVRGAAAGVMRHNRLAVLPHVHPFASRVK